MVNHEDQWLQVLKNFILTCEIFSLEVILFKIRNDIPVTVAATIMINPCTAYRFQRHQVFADC